MKRWMVVFLVVVSGWAVEWKLRVPTDILATGGAGIAADDKTGLLFMNPAVYAMMGGRRFLLGSFGGGANFSLVDIYDIYNQLAKNSNDLASLTPDQWKKLSSLSLYTSMIGPLYLGYMGDNVGIVLFNDFRTFVKQKVSPIVPYFEWASYLDIGLQMGAGFGLPDVGWLPRQARLYGGISIKILNRVKYENERLSLLELMDKVNAIMSFQDGFLMGQAIGSDVGLLYKQDRWRVGLVVRDWFTTSFQWVAYDARFKVISNEAGMTTWWPSVDVGVAYQLGSVLSKYLFGNVVLYADMVNITDWRENGWLKTRFGVEGRMFGFLLVRGGLYKGYPTVGVGLDFPFVKTHMTYYTEELGTIPGASPLPILVSETQFVF
ncbi:MAG: hypothetical protein HPY78_07205 [Brevinematales bacterium]|nr:hypothetical protein [Brevinematales bacterium]